LLAIVTATAPALAREPNEAAAELDALAKTAYRAKKWDDAIAGFEAAYEADPLPRFLFNLGRCHEKRGDLARASHFLEQYLREAPGAEDAKKVKALVKMLRVKLRKKASRVEVATEPTGALLALKGGGETYDAVSPFSGWIPFGEYELSVSMEGYEAATRQVVVRPKKSVQVSLALRATKAPVVALPEESKPAEPPAPKPEVQPPKGREPEPQPPKKAEPAASGPSPWAWPALGVGAAGLVAGVVFGVLARSEEDAETAAIEEARSTGVGKRDEILAHNDAARRNAVLADVGYAVAVVGIGAGVLLLVLAGPDEAIAPFLSPRSVGVVGRF